MGLFTLPRNPNFSAIFVPCLLCTPHIMYGASLKQGRENFRMQAIPFLRLLLVPSCPWPQPILLPSYSDLAYHCPWLPTPFPFNHRLPTLALKILCNMAPT